jgi:hypothetical protein
VLISKGVICNLGQSFNDAIIPIISNTRDTAWSESSDESELSCCTSHFLSENDFYTTKMYTTRHMDETHVHIFVVHVSLIFSFTHFWRFILVFSSAAVQCMLYIQERPISKD